MAKSNQIIEVLERRIKHGDYLIKEIPSERELASEFNVSPLTARRTYLELIERGLLTRKANGRLGVNQSKLGQMCVAFVVPCLSQHVELWRVAISYAAEKFNSVIRPFYFMHWDDPVIVNDLSNFDGVFILPIEEAIPPKILERFQKRIPPVVSLDHDLSEYGIPSLDVMPSVFVQNLLDYLFSLGHRAISCLSVAGKSGIIDKRIHQWQIWKVAHGVSGDLIKKELEDPRATSLFGSGYQVMKELLKKPLNCTAILCTTTACAMGVMRACIEQGITVGKDLSICSIDGEGFAPFLTPRLTTLENADPSVYLALCFEWFQRRGENWIGPLKMVPTTPTIFYGESTGSVKVHDDGVEELIITYGSKNRKEVIMK